jgi:hypothetical protein
MGFALCGWVKEGGTSCCPLPAGMSGRAQPQQLPSPCWALACPAGIPTAYKVHCGAQREAGPFMF